MIDLSQMEQTEAQILAALGQEVRRQAEEGLERLSMDCLMEISPWSRRHMERLFRDYYLTSPSRYFRDCQTDIAGRLLAQGDDVLSASTKSGFASPGRLHDAIIRRYGLTPGEVRRKGAGVSIYYGFFETQVGIVLMAGTARGLSWMRLCGANATSDQAMAKLEELRTEFEFAQLEEAPELMQSYADQLVAFLEARSPGFCPTLDILEGTTFQREVWAEVQRIAPGETATYADIARRIGRPKATRAVAQAIGRNTLAIAIPCHRVIREDGSLAGYRWGIEWKDRLLRLEAEMHERKSANGSASAQEARAGR